MTLLATQIMVFILSLCTTFLLHVCISVIKLIKCDSFYDNGSSFRNETTNHLLIETPLDFLNRRGLGLIHINVRSLIPKLDSIRIWVQQTYPDILILTESWLSGKIKDHLITLDGYNTFRVDRSTRGGVVAIFVKKCLLSLCYSLCRYQKNLNF